MAQRVEVVLTDDLDGKTLADGKGETVRFALDGVTYEIDVSTKNAQALRKALAPYIEAGRKRTVRGARPARSRGGADAKSIKAWARVNGYQVNDRGRVANDVRAAFEAAH